MRRVIRLEAAKLGAQGRVRAVLALCLLAPFIFAAGIEIQNGLPTDTLFGRHLHESGFATPLVVLAFTGTWALPLLTSVVAGGIVAAEDQHRTWSLLLTRDTTRSAVFAGKALIAGCFACAMLLALASGSLLAGVLIVGHQPLLALDGALLGPGRLVGLVLAAWLSVLPPVLGFTGVALFVSTTTRSVAAGIAAPAVAGLAMLLLGFINGPEWLHSLLLTSGFDAWHGLIRTAPYYGPLVRSLIVSTGWAFGGTLGGWLVLRRRDFDGA